MKELYSSEVFQAVKHKAKVAIVLSNVIFFLSLALVLLSGLIINEDNSLIIKIIDSIILVAGLGIFLYQLFDVYTPNKNKQKFMYRLLTVSSYKGKMQILSIKAPYLVQKGVMAYEINVSFDNKKTTYYLESSNELTFKENDVVTLMVANNFIIAIGDSNDE